jgi:rhodanese-related sulfurtransferase
MRGPEPAPRQRQAPVSITPGRADVELRSGGAIALDVRERREYEAGTVPGARWFPVVALDPGQLDPHGRYITVCSSGSRSAVAARRLRDAGLDAVKLEGGLTAWRGMGLPVR